MAVQVAVALGEAGAPLAVMADRISIHTPVIAHVIAETAGTHRGAVAAGQAAPGDVLLITKGIAIEGTSVLARERTLELRRAGVRPEVIRVRRSCWPNPASASCRRLAPFVKRAA